MSDIGGCCKILAKIYGVIGAIGSIVLANIYGKESEVNYYFERVEYQQNWELTIAIFVGVLLVVSMICIALYTIGAIYDAVNSSAFQKGGVARYEKLGEGTSVIAEQDEVNKIIENDGWRCSDCGKINQSYITTCMCGKSKE